MTMYSMWPERKIKQREERIMEKARGILRSSGQERE